jgi:phage terminase small subunit
VQILNITYNQAYKSSKLMSRKINKQQIKFAEYYIESGNARQSAIHAGYSPSSASYTGHKLLRNPKVEAYLKSLMASQLSEIGVTKTGLIGSLVGLITKDTTSDSDKIKAIDVINKMSGYYLRPLDLLLQLPEEQIFRLIQDSKKALNIHHEEIKP